VLVTGRPRRLVGRPVAGLMALVAGLTACGGPTDPGVVGGDPAEGRVLLREYGCASCHQIPGVPGPQGRVGPPLGDVAERRVIAGTLINTPDNLRLWIQEPQQIQPETLMPDLGVTDEDVDDIVAYLYSLEEP
jgi:cytochrome c